jgi:hypothetical protein
MRSRSFKTANVLKQQARILNGVVKARRRAPQVSKRERGGRGDVCLPFIPPENWYEPTTDGASEVDYRIVEQPPGEGFSHVVTAEEVRDRLEQVPQHFLRLLEVVQLSRMTRKKCSFPCYGMQWGSALYLYPIESSLVEEFDSAPRPALKNETSMYGGKWVQEGTAWRLVWTEDTIKDYYLNNILIHELGHLLDDRNSSYTDRERFAEWFAIEYGYQPTRAARDKRLGRRVVRRHARA